MIYISAVPLAVLGSTLLCFIKEKSAPLLTVAVKTTVRHRAASARVRLKAYGALTAVRKRVRHDGGKKRTKGLTELP